METVKLRVRYHNTKLEKLKEITVGDAIDVRCAEEVYLERGDFKKLPLGFSMDIPEGYYALLIPRSGTFGKYGIIQTNSVGLIDHSYNGDNDVWKIPVLCMADSSEIHFGDRIAQFLIFKKIPVQIEEVDHLGNPDRGGFGSTGVN